MSIQTEIREISKNDVYKKISHSLLMQVNKGHWDGPLSFFNGLWGIIDEELDKYAILR